MRYLLQDDILEIPEAITYDDINIVPRKSNIKSRSDIDITTRLVGDIYLTNPVIPANMDSITDVDMMIAAANNGSVGFLHRFMDLEETPPRIEEFCTNVDITKHPIGISIGISALEMLRANSALSTFKTFFTRDGKIYTDKPRMVILIDVAHGHHTSVIRAISEVKRAIKDEGLEGFVFVIAGNVATGSGARDLVNAGADGIKVGVGNGSLCETRIRSGAGVPQVSALAEVWKELCILTGSTYNHSITIIADGGVKFPGDVAKALWLGAGAVMSGYLFAGTNETPGSVIKKGLFPQEREMKIYRGSASYASKADRGESKNIEGNIKEIPARGPVKYIFDQVKDGVQSGFSYVGAENIIEFRTLARIVRITNNGVIEARPNLLNN